jgi:hypothetical protein
MVLDGTIILNMRKPDHPIYLFYSTASWKQLILDMYNPNLIFVKNTKLLYSCYGILFHNDL